jgi:hypothetical protein
VVTAQLMNNLIEAATKALRGKGFLSKALPLNR